MKIKEYEEIPNYLKDGDTILIAGKGLSSYTHGVFKYPCKFIPHVPRWFIKKYGSEITKRAGVLDPFSGSGTTLVESCLLGYPSYGIDIDSLSILVSKVKSTKLNVKEMSLLQDIYNTLEKKLKSTKAPAKRVTSFIPNLDNIDHWFSKKVIHDLAFLKLTINDLYDDNKNKHINDFLMVTLASIIRRVSNADNQSPKPYIRGGQTKPIPDVFTTYIRYFAKYLKSIIEFSTSTELSGKVIGFEARKIDKKAIKNGKVHLVMTSPPYINAFDYVRSLKLENAWLGIMDSEDISRLYDIHIGTEKISASKYNIGSFSLGISDLDQKLNQIFGIDKKRAHIVADYFISMEQNIKEVSSVLIKSGFYCIVVGDSTIRGIQIPTSRYLIEIAKRNGFKKVEDFSYIIRNRYLRIPRSGRGGIIPKDYIIVLRKK